METVRQQPIAILGAGSWGTALALYLARLGQEVRLWTCETDHAEIMLAEKMNNRYLPGIPFPPSLVPTLSIKEAVKGVKDILLVVPSEGFRDTINFLKPVLQPTMRLICAAKGLDPLTGQLLHEVKEEMLGTSHPYAILSGPSFAREVAMGLPTAVVIASPNEPFSQELWQRFNSPLFRIHLSTDLVGVEIGGSVKNVIAIATGLSDGLENGANARSVLMTRALEEMMRLGLALGAQSSTFMGLAGIGDLILTCTDNQSRNRRFGLALAKGKNAADAAREISQVVEGKRNAELIAQLAKKTQVTMPIVEMVWNIVQEKMNPTEAMQQLFAH